MTCDPVEMQVDTASATCARAARAVATAAAATAAERGCTVAAAATASAATDAATAVCCLNLLKTDGDVGDEKYLENHKCMDMHTGEKIISVLSPAEK